MGNSWAIRVNSRLFCSQVSQGLYYIRDCKTGAIDPVTNASLRSFLRDLKGNFISFQQVNWLDALFKESADYITTVIEDATLSDMCRHNVPISKEEPRQHVRYWEQNKRLFTRNSHHHTPAGKGRNRYSR